MALPFLNILFTFEVDLFIVCVTHDRVSVWRVEVPVWGLVLSIM